MFELKAVPKSGTARIELSKIIGNKKLMIRSPAA